MSGNTSKINNQTHHYSQLSERFMAHQAMYQFAKNDAPKLRKQKFSAFQKSFGRLHDNVLSHVNYDEMDNGNGNGTEKDMFTVQFQEGINDILTKAIEYVEYDKQLFLKHQRNHVNTQKYVPQEVDGSYPPNYDDIYLLVQGHLYDSREIMRRFFEITTEYTSHTLSSVVFMLFEPDTDMNDTHLELQYHLYFLQEAYTRLGPYLPKDINYRNQVLRWLFRQYLKSFEDIFIPEYTSFLKGKTSFDATMAQIYVKLVEIFATDDESIESLLKMILFSMEENSFIKVFTPNSTRTNRGENTKIQSAHFQYKGEKQLFFSVYHTSLHGYEVTDTRNISIHLKSFHNENDYYLRMKTLQTHLANMQTHDGFDYFTSLGQNALFHIKDVHTKEVIADMVDFVTPIVYYRKKVQSSPSPLSLTPLKSNIINLLKSAVQNQSSEVVRTHVRDNSRLSTRSRLTKIIDNLTFTDFAKNLFTTLSYIDPMIRTWKHGVIQTLQKGVSKTQPQMIFTDSCFQVPFNTHIPMKKFLESRTMMHRVTFSLPPKNSLIPIIPSTKTLRKTTRVKATL